MSVLIRTEPGLQFMSGGGKKFGKYGVFTKFFPVGEDRMAVWEIDGKWKLYTRTGVKVILGDMVDESGRFFVYKCPEGVKFSRIEGTRLINNVVQRLSAGIKQEHHAVLF